jgi:hypothetical protein
MGNDRTRKESPDKPQPQKGKLPAAGVSRQSKEEQFRIGDREKALLKDLFDWSERSSETHWVLGRPLGAQG